MDQVLIERVVELSRSASDAILSIYEDESAYDVDMKSDESPITQADIAAHKILQSGLLTLLPDTPVLSEESIMPEAKERLSWERYWLVDPLDGTKEFIQRNGEFTVNIALVERGVPILGVVAVPVTGVVYWGCNDQQNESNKCAGKIDRGTKSMLSTRAMKPHIQANKSIEVVSSRRHGSDNMASLMSLLQKNFVQIEQKSMGSSLKLCLIAEGKADIYPRLAPTSEWDTAAAQAIVEAAGGVVVDLSFRPLRYNTQSSLLNPYFYVLGDHQYPWEALLKPHCAGWQE